MTSWIPAISTSAYLYGFLLTIAFSLSLALFRFNLSETGVNKEYFIDFALLITIVSIIGARILYIFLYPHQFSGLRDYLALHEGGLVFFGGFILSTTSIFAFALFKKIDLFELFDSLAPSMALGHAIGRLGCFANDCCYGSQTCLINIYHLPGDHEGVFRHPTQLYESAFLFALAIFLQLFFMKSYRDNLFRRGLTTTIYLSSYTFVRFLIEFIRGDDRGGFFLSLHLSISQLLSIGIFILTIIFATFSYYKTDRTREKSNE